jgi:hypothetical protein
MEDVMDICSILQPSGIFYGLCVVIWYIFPVLVYRTKKNLATMDVGGKLNLKKLRGSVTVFARYYGR